MDNVNQDELIIKQQEAIQKDIAENSCLVSEKLPLQQLEQEFEADPVFKSKITKLGEKYSQFRRIRPDGNCFFRAVGFRLFEKLREDAAELTRIQENVKPSKDQMVKLGMPEFTVEDFYDNFMSSLDELNGENKMNEQELDKMFNDEGVSNYLVVFLRLLTSKQLQLEGEFYQNFMEGGRTVAEFCNTDVEPMYRESDHIHIIGLTAAAGINVRVVYLDRGSGDEAVHHDFPEDSQPQIHVLYRPGHYDVLYPKEMNENDTNADDEIITAGRTVILQRDKYMRTHLLNPNKNLQLSKDIVNLSGIVGQRFGTTFKMVSDHSKNKCFKLEVAEEVKNFENIFMNGESGEDNRDLTDKDNQKLSRDEINKMREDGVDGVEIVEKLIENSETFQNKTKFSQEKFLKKKAKKYHQYILVRKPSIRLLMDINYNADPMKILNLRVDSLAQILTMTNVHSGGKYLVYETGAQGLVVSSVLERVGHQGSVTHIYQTGQPQTNCLAAMDYPPEVMANLNVINIQHLRSLDQGLDILANHKNEEAYDTGEPPAKKPAKDDTENGDKIENGSGGKTENGIKAEKPVRMNLREKSVVAYEKMSTEKCDGLIIVCKQHPSAILMYLSKFVCLSGQFTVYSPYKEPLLDAYMTIKESGKAINVNLSENWLRNYQVLPDRTHPHVNMSGGGGYILTGILVE